MSWPNKAAGILALAAALSVGTAGSVAQAAPVHWKSSVVDYEAQGKDIKDVLRDFGASQGIPTRISADIDNAWEVLGEAVQTVLRAAGVPEGYERLKDFTRGRTIDAQALAAFIDTLPLPAAEKTRLKALTPQAYTGLAAHLAREI